MSSTPDTPLVEPPAALDEWLTTLSTLEQLQGAREVLAERDAQLGQRIARLRSGPSTRELAHEYAAQGLTSAQIARRLGVREDYVPRLLARAPGGRGKGRPRAGWEDELRPLLEQGLPVREIAQRLGWAEKTAANRASKLRAGDRDRGDGSKE